MAAGVWPLREQPLWLGLFAILSNIPLCIWGAHLAKRHIPPAA